MKKHAIVEIGAEIMIGMPVFAGTRVPVRNPIDCLEAVGSHDEFLEDFPTISRWQARVFPGQASERQFPMTGL